VTAQTTGIDSIKVVGNHAPPYRIIENDSFSGIYFDIMKEMGEEFGEDLEKATFNLKPKG